MNNTHERATSTEIGLLSLWREDWASNGRNWFSLGFRAVAVHRLAERAKAASNPLSRFALWRIYWFWQRHCRNRGIEIPPGVELGRRVAIYHQGGIVFHPATKIGNGCVIRHGVTLGAGSTRRSRAAPTLEENVDIGAGAALLGGITVGRDSRIGANVVLLESVPAESVVVPAAAVILQRGEDGRYREWEKSA